MTNRTTRAVKDRRTEVVESKQDKDARYMKLLQALQAVTFGARRDVLEVALLEELGLEVPSENEENAE